jgi:hypothetical protein
VTARTKAQKAKPPEHRPNLEFGTSEVENPMFSRDHAAGKQGNVRRITAIINIRESGIATMTAKGALDTAQVAAADKYRQLWETMGGAGAGAIDYGRVNVDGGPAREPITERQVSAGKEVNRCRNLLGRHGFELVTMIAGQRKSLHDLYSTRRDRDTAADMLRVYLTQLAEMWGYATPRPYEQPRSNLTACA